MMVVGGSYLERTVVPSTSALWGSGLKAAAALASFSRDVHLITSVSAGERSQLQLVAQTFGLSVDVVERRAQIAFEYYTPVSKPTISGQQQPAVEIRAVADAVLVFGMLEAVPDIRARTMVFDPQSPAESPIPHGIRRSCERLAIVLNRHEARRASKRKRVEASARSILDRTGAEVVVVKCGAIGAFVAEAAHRPQWVPAFETTQVWPIGSGDVFSASFAWHWAKRGRSAQEAARAASLATAWWSATHQFPLPRRLRLDGRFVLRALPPRTPRVYLAAPFFGVQEEWLVDTVLDTLRDLGAEVFSPLHEIGRGGEDVAEQDLRGLRGCSSVLALLDRCDAGTIFEVGYAIARGIPVVGFTGDPNVDALKMLRGTGVDFSRDLATAVYRAAWAGM